MKNEEGKYFIEIPRNGYWLNTEGIETVEKHYQAKYMGAWCIRDKHGNWTEQPVDIFYIANPDTSKGHTNYLGMFIKEGKFMVTDGSTAFSNSMVGIVTENNEVLVSHYRHDYVTKDGFMIDGGRDYTKTNCGRQVTVTVNNGEFIFE